MMKKILCIASVCLFLGSGFAQDSNSVSNTPHYYKLRYNEQDLLKKIVDNWGNGYDTLYGTRNVRPVLHGVAYRGGANNYYHKTDKRNNHNPLPPDGMKALCKEGFSTSIYLYQNNFESASGCEVCLTKDSIEQEMDYRQLDYFDPTHVYEILKLVYESAKDTTKGPVYLHCWNGWHASGYISALILKQFCGFSDLEAVSYWDLGTDGMNYSPRYKKIRDDIKNFKPYSEFYISDALGNTLCPPMPKIIDSSQLRLGIEHLVMVPEALPVGTTLILENIQFEAGKTSFANISKHPDILKVLTSLKNTPNFILEIGGHTDKSGSEEKNIELSTQRAKFVMDYLLSTGVEPHRLSYKGYGSAKPMYSNKNAEGRNANRRIEVKIISKGNEDLNKLKDE
jgi:outer membrane protein OmpA-like peptidoglycan-associated protein